MSTALLEAPPKKRKRQTRRVTDSTPTTSELLKETFPHPPLQWGHLDLATLFWMVLVHVGCLAAPFFFSWSGLGIAVFLYWITGSIGICLCYHRYLAHRSFKLTRPAEFLVYLCGVLALEGGPLTWAATHRVHHARSDKPGDPHSPRDGKWWSHILWLFTQKERVKDSVFKEKIVPDLLRDPMIVFFEHTFFYWTVALGVLLFAIGGWSWLLWGICVRMVVTYHATWFVNSATHLWGYRNYETKDDSRNLWWVAAITGGEGWHNNHHAYPALAIAGHRWYEFDTTYWSIWCLKKLGLAYDVADKLPESAKAKLKLA